MILGGVDMDFVKNLPIKFDLMRFSASKSDNQRNRNKVKWSNNNITPQNPKDEGDMIVYRSSIKFDRVYGD